MWLLRVRNGLEKFKIDCHINSEMLIKFRFEKFSLLNQQFVEL